MGRWLAAGAEVIGCADNAFAEMVLPDAIDDDTGGERVVGLGEPFGQGETAAAGIGRNELSAEQLEISARYFISRIVGITALLQPGIVRGAFGDSIGLSGGSIGERDGHRVTRHLGVLAAGERIAGAIEDAVQGVVIAHRDGVELVIVAAGTAEGETENGLAERVDGVIDSEVEVAGDVEAEAARDGEVAGGDDQLAPLFLRQLGRQDVAGDLLAEELVVGFIVVEGIDDVVAIAPGVGDGEVGGLAGRVGIAHDIEPVPSPALTVVRRGQQPIDQPFVSVRCRVVHEGLDVVRGRGQAEKIESGTANERAPVGRCGRLEAVLALAVGDEGVDRIAGPG